MITLDIEEAQSFSAELYLNVSVENFTNVIHFLPVLFYFIRNIILMSAMYKYMCICLYTHIFIMKSFCIIYLYTVLHFPSGDNGLFSIVWSTFVTVCVLWEQGCRSSVLSFGLYTFWTLLSLSVLFIGLEGS